VSVGLGGPCGRETKCRTSRAFALAYRAQPANLHDDSHLNSWFDFDLFADADHAIPASNELDPIFPANPPDFSEYADALFPDLHAGSGATSLVSDEPGIAAEADHLALSTV
jgi:hypothetical protein